ncbi:MAG: PorV/PorQ family protein [Ignavibacteria bacterium]|nr:PorV/PorQ family protein [Ignavibacteria bacterium]MBI3765216.1 PorV/PorQ family protein [Ignavibacteriales bacterium]
MKQFCLPVLLTIVGTAACLAQTAGTAGAFARMGFNGRGMGMGNALTAVNTGDVSPYYNPALSAFSERRTASATFSFLAFDRYLNFLSYTQSLKPRAGISIGLINAGVRKIDGRDADGYHTQDLSTFENQVFLSFSNRVDDNVSLGVTVKLYYSKLYENVKSTTVGFDLGAQIQLTTQVSLGATIQDINSKYKWDTKSIYGQDGKTTEDKFPNLRRIGVAYNLPENVALISVEFENSSEKTNLFRMGVEYRFLENFAVRGGVDRWEFGDNATGAKPSFGFTIKNSFNGWTPTINYGFVVESFAPHGMHIITLSAEF